MPIGAIIVKDNKVISRGFNKRESLHDVSAHAEMIALKKANKKLDNWRLVDCDLYVTIEPCLMCMGAIYQSHIRNVYYGSKDPKGGATHSVVDFSEIKNLNHYPHIEGGILEEECSQIVKDYFEKKRKQK